MQRTLLLEPQDLKEVSLEGGVLSVLYTAALEEQRPMVIIELTADGRSLMTHRIQWAEVAPVTGEGDGLTGNVQVNRPESNADYVYECELLKRPGRR